MSLGKVVIGGGTGLVGTFLRKALTNEGFSCVCVSRSPPPHIDGITWKDLERNGLPKDTVAAINLAGTNVLHDLRWTEKFKQQIVDSRVETTKCMAKAVADSNTKVFATISGVGYYTSHETAEYTEESICEPTEFFSKLCNVWEAAAQLPENSNTRRFVIRSGLVVAPNKLMQQGASMTSKTRVSFVVGSGQQWVPWIHITDLCNMFIFGIKNEHVSGILNGVSPHTIRYKEYANSVAKEAGGRITLSVPDFVIKYLLHPERAHMILTGPKVLPERVQKLGFKYQYAKIDDACTQVFGVLREMS